jgi:GTP-binding protein
MPTPQVVIVGRPNVGKSSVFNWLARRRLAIVDDQPGVTRDRLSQLLCERERYFDLVDTGGIGFVDPDNLSGKVEEQIDVAIESAAVILMVVDTREGWCSADEEVVRRVRGSERPTLVLANKADDAKLDPATGEFLRLGLGEPLCVSTLQNRGRDELLDWIAAHLPDEANSPPPVDPIMKVTIVGRRNVGKSTFVNSIAQSERCIVSEVPGTTRDSVDVRFELDGKTFIAIDTPGLRKRKSVTTDIDFYSAHRAERSIRRADVVLVFFDCAQPISQVDKQLCGYVIENYKPCIFVVNKWDQYAGKIATEDWVKYISDTFRTLHYAPIAFVTGQTGKNVKMLLNHAQMLFKQSQQRIGTGDLNRAVRAAMQQNPPPIVGTRRAKVYYGTQVDMAPPTIVLFCNDEALFPDSYKRYLLTSLRETLPFPEVPIKLYLRDRPGGNPPPRSQYIDEPD